MRKRDPRNRLYSYNETIIGNFYVKASVLGEQIVILVQNRKNLKIECRSFVQETDAVKWLEFISETH